MTLYWAAQQQPEDDYVVFVHLLDDAGQAVAQRDGPPMDGRYATSPWLPGDIVPDAHHLTLDPQTSVGTCRLYAGMYHWPSLERLRAWDCHGAEHVDRVVFL